MNNVEWQEENINKPPEERIGKLIPAKHKFRGPGIPMAIGTGFPDFIIFRPLASEVIGVEVKSNGYLDKTEREKCDWLLYNHIFHSILIAKKVKGGIQYDEYKTKGK